MNNAQKYLELVRNELKARGESDSDYNVSKWLNVSRVAVGHWKTGRNGIDFLTGHRIAKLLRKDSSEVIIKLLDDGFQEPELREFFVETFTKKGSNDAA